MPATQIPPKVDEDLRAQLMGKVIQEAREIIDHLNLCLIQLDQDFKDEAMIDTITRGFHTIKGSSGFVGLNQLGTIAKAFEMSMREVKKGAINLSPAAVTLMYEGLDAIAVIIDKAENNDFTAIDDRQLMAKVERFKSGAGLEAEGQPAEPTAAPSSEVDELLKIYREGYQQLSALKHLIFSSIHLTDPETLAEVLSRQIQEHIGPPRHSLWLIDPNEQIIETARDGKRVEMEARRAFKPSDSEFLQRILHEQLIYWPPGSTTLQTTLPEYASPVIFPIKLKTTVLGLLILDLKEKSEIELYQFITQFAAMMLHAAGLHQKVTEQHKALDDMAAILLKQNSHLSTLHHVEMNLMQEKDPLRLCQIVVDVLASELDTVRAAAFLYQPARQEFLCAAQSSGFTDLADQRFGLTEIRALEQVQRSGRMMAHINYGETLRIGANALNPWVALAIKGRQEIHGVMLVEIGEAEFSDAIGIITQFLGLLLDGIALNLKAA
ncbi:MAG: Hpt domain-containing protein [Desulfobacteraceae bacterium]|nr:Hpt domain-containing protein [Desulfobacteraceae bacterium]